VVMVTLTPLFSQQDLLDRYPHQFIPQYPELSSGICPCQSWRFAGLLSMQIDIYFRNETELNAFEPWIAVNDLFDFYHGYPSEFTELARRGNIVRFHHPGLSSPIDKIYRVRWPRYGYDSMLPNPLYGWSHKEFGKTVMATRGGNHICFCLLLEDTRF